MDKFDRSIDVLAQELYNTHWGPNPVTGRFPPVWVDLQKETKEFVRKQALNVAKMALSRDWTGTKFEHIKSKNVCAPDEESGVKEEERTSGAVE